MKHYLVGFILVAFLVISGCSGTSPTIQTHNPKNNGPMVRESGFIPQMNNVAPMKFPTGVSDTMAPPGQVDYLYLIGKTEVTYAQWCNVYSWAIYNGYTFAHPGTKGDGVNDTGEHPVTTVSWLDAMVWCNALTEYSNLYYGTSYACVYTFSGAIIRDATDDSISGNVSFDLSAKGFRLPTSAEWELSARYIGDYDADGDILDSNEFYPGNHVSGDITGHCYPPTGASTLFGNYAWYGANSGDSTHPVATKAPNGLGLYDMSGNVWEWCFDFLPGSGYYRMFRGGAFHSEPYFLQLGRSSGDAPIIADPHLGFRLARTE